MFDQTSSRIAISATVALALSTGLACAQGQHPRATASSQAAAPLASGFANGAPCKTAVDTQTGVFTPPDDSTLDNGAANTVAFIKTCNGIVVATFSAEVNTPNAGNTIHLDIRATCVATAGQVDPCTVGQTVTASPGHTFLRNTSGATQVHSMTMFFPALKRGQWRFRAQLGAPAGNTTANVEFRTFLVQAY
jgi:hypothetical protein